MGGGEEREGGEGREGEGEGFSQERKGEVSSRRVCGGGLHPKRKGF